MNIPERFFTLLRARTTKDQRRFIKFLVVGASGVPVNLGTVAISTHMLSGLLAARYRDTIAFFLGIVVSIFSNFLLNNAWTWADRASEDPTGFFRRLAKFYVVSALAASVQFGTSVGLSTLMRESAFFSVPLGGEVCLYHILAPLTGILLGLGINFTVNHLWTFAKKR